MHKHLHPMTLAMALTSCAMAPDGTVIPGAGTSADIIPDTHPPRSPRPLPRSHAKFAVNVNA